ncbi:MAG: YtxH domain-containing protein [Actinomycetota bacterium]
MRYKVTFITGFAAGFVVGARAGRERYEQLKKVARAAADSPAAQQAAAALQAKAAGAATTARDKVAGQLHEGMANAKDHVPGIRHRHPDSGSNGHSRVTTTGGSNDGS